MTSNHDPAGALAEHVRGCGFADLRASTRTATCEDILDMFGCWLGGSGAPGIAELCRVVGGWGGSAHGQVMLWQRRLPAPQAAMMNAGMAHARDFDDTLDHGSSIHPRVSVLAASLAISEMLGGVSGRDLLLAVAPGHDVSCRVALAAARVHGRVGITEVADIHNVRVLDVAARMAGVAGEWPNSGVAVSRRDGRVANATVGRPLGSPDNRLSDDQPAMTFADCARNAVQPLPDDTVRTAIDTIRHPEDLPNTGELLRHFV